MTTRPTTPETGSSSIRNALVRLVSISGIAFALSCPLRAGFIDAYAIDNFTLTNCNADGSVFTPDDGLTAVLIGGNNGSGNPGTTWWVIESVGTGLVSFDYSYFTANTLPGDNWGGYVLNGTFTQLANSSGASGSASFDVNAGDIFGFEIGTLDNQGEPGILSISDFSAPTGGAAPEPATGWILLAPAVAAMYRFRIRGSSHDEKGNHPNDAHAGSAVGDRLSASRR